MKLKHILLLIFCATFLACNIEPVDLPLDDPINIDTPDDDNNDEEEDTDDDDTDDDNNETILIKQMVQTFTDGSITTIDYTYDGNKLINVLDSDGYKYDYIYEEDLLIRVNSFVDDIMHAYTTFEYNENREIASVTLYIIDDNTFKDIFTRNTDNTITVETYITNQNSQTSLNNSYTIDDTGDILIKQVNKDLQFYEYDDKNGAFKNIFALDYLNYLSLDFGKIEGNENNITKYDESKLNTGSDIYIDTYTFEYNEKDYPIKAFYSSTYNGELDDEAVIEYFYE